MSARTNYIALTLLAAFVAGGLGLSAASGAAVSMAVRPEPVQKAQPTEAEQLFADAPFGVDPIVTGPSTAPFRHQQKIAGCDKAVWPNIPAACYPG